MTSMSELQFDRPLDGGEEFLKEFVSGLMLFKGWEIMKKGVCQKMQEYMPEEHPLIEPLDIDTKFLLFLEVIGPEFRDLWGGPALEKYKPELLREPYISEDKRDELLETLNVIYLAYIEELMADDSELTFQKNAFFIETKAHYQTLLKYKEDRHKGNRSVIREDLGSALTAIMRNEDLLVRLLSSPLTPESSYNRRVSDTADAQQYGLGGMKTQEDLEEEEVRSIVDKFNKQTVDDMCLHLRGCFLSDSLRTELWAYRFLTRSSIEPPNTKNATPGRDYRRLAKEKGLDVHVMQQTEIEDNQGGASSIWNSRDRNLGLRRKQEMSMHTLISESVWTSMQSAMATSVNIAARKAYAANPWDKDNKGEDKQPTSESNSTLSTPKPNPNPKLGMGTTFGPASDVASIGALARRVGLLVHAGYILNDEINSRSINVAIMILRAFPSDPPTCEKILRMYQRILTECMPSEQLHKDYSLASVAHTAWGLLLERDPTLLHFLQNYDINFDDDQYDAGLGQDDEGEEEEGDRLPTKRNHKPDTRITRDASNSSNNAAMEIPRSLLLLKGWLEDGFIGKVPEYAALYIWDQLMLFGACPTDFRRMLPVLCCIVLQALREPIMALPKNLDLVMALHELGMDLRTRDIVELIREESSFAPDKPTNARSGTPELSGEDPHTM